MFRPQTYDGRRFSQVAAAAMTAYCGARTRGICFSSSGEPCFQEHPRTKGCRMHWETMHQVPKPLSQGPWRSNTVRARNSHNPPPPTRKRKQRPPTRHAVTQIPWQLQTGSTSRDPQYKNAISPTRPETLIRQNGDTQLGRQTVSSI